MRVRSRVVRPRALSVPTGDVALTAALCAAWAAEVLLNATRSAPVAATLVAGWALIAPVAWRRRAPVIALAVRGALTVVAGALDTGVLDGPHNVQGVAVAVLMYSIGAHGEGRALIGGVTVAVAIAATHAALTGRPLAPSTILGVTAVVAAPVVTGRAIRQRRRLAAALRERADTVAAESQTQVQRAADQERRRIARELHDIVTHVLGEMVVLAASLRRAGAPDGGRYAQTLGDIERAGREALVELRRLLGVLRAGAPQSLSPTPTTRQVHDLAAAARSHGVPVGLTVEGTPDAVPAGIAVSAYRAVEAAVTRALEQHAGRIRVALRYAPDATEVEVFAEPPAPGAEGDPPDLMVAAIRERVAVCGGQFRTQRHPDDSVSVWVRLPHHGSGSRALIETGSSDRGEGAALGPVRREWRTAAEASLAPLLFIALVVDALPGGPLRGGGAPNALAFGVLAGTFAWRRRAPVAAAATLAAVAVVLTAFLTPVPELQTAKVAFLAMVYLTAAGTEGRAAVLGASILAAGALGTAIVHGMAQLTSRQVYALVTFAALAWFAGRLVRSHSALNRTLAERAAALEREREEEEWRAVADVRRQIARELHDVVAHGLTVMVVQAGSARRIAAADPEDAARAVTLIEATGREALTEMRRLLSVITDDEDAAPRLASPGISSLEGLLERSRAAGVEVDVRRDGVPRPLPAGVDLAAYRVVQEALTNTIKHAHAAHAQLVVRYCDDALELLVADDGDGRGVPLAGSGQGLAGMRERVTIYGGELDARPDDGGGFLVRARFPLGSAS